MVLTSIQIVNTVETTGYRSITEWKVWSKKVYEKAGEGSSVRRCMFSPQLIYDDTRVISRATSGMLLPTQVLVEDTVARPSRLL